MAGTLCDAAPSTDSPALSGNRPNAGATWYALEGSGEVTGLLVVDACADGACEAIDFNEARVFQMFSSGKTTSLRLSVHDERGDQNPEWDDPGWQTVTGFEPIGAGRDDLGDGTLVSDPTVLPTGPHVTRYVRVEARNDGSLGSADYIELRSLKLFSVSLL